MPSSTVSDAEDDEVGETSFRFGEIVEGKGLVHGLAVLVPKSNDFGLGLSGFGSSGVVALVKRSAVISFEEISGGSCSKHHALD